jgi:phage protein D
LEAIEKNIVEVIIAGKNVTGDVSRFLSQASYTDKIEDESDDVTLTFEDTEAIWQQEWYPTQGDTLTVKLGNSENMVDCGLFEIDEIELSIAPDMLAVKGIATSISKGLRTKNNKAFEKQTLRKIAEFFAKKHGLKLTGTSGNLQRIILDRKTQKDQTDISFLAGLGKEFGIIFSVRGKQLIFTEVSELEKQPAVVSLDRTNVSSASFRDKTSQTYQNSLAVNRNVKKNVKILEAK